MYFIGGRMFHYKLAFCVVLSLVCLCEPAEAKSVLSPSRATEFIEVSNHADLQQVKREASLSDKGILIAFVGTPWCPWSKKMEEEVLCKKKLLSSLEEDCLLVKIAVPAKLGEDPSHAELNTLAKEFHIKESPTFVLLSSEGELITEEGFFPLEAEALVEHWKECFQAFKEISTSLADPSGALSESTLQAMYQKAKSLSFHKWQTEIIERGIKLAGEPFFFLEKYESLSADRKTKDPELQALRKRICALDPRNEKRAHLRLAMIDFSTQQERKKRRRDPKVAVEPLLSYIKEFGEKDPENLWKLEMMVAQFLFSKGKCESAIEHAEKSLKASPEAIRKDVDQTLAYLKESAKTTLQSATE